MYYYQFGVFSSEEGAKKILKHVVNLAKQNSIKENVKINKENNFYKIKMGPYSSKENAKNVATNIAEKDDLINDYFIVSSN